MQRIIKKNSYKIICKYEKKTQYINTNLSKKLSYYRVYNFADKATFKLIIYDMYRF